MLLHKVRWCRLWLCLPLSNLSFTQTPAKNRWCTNTKAFRTLGGLGCGEFDMAVEYCGQFLLLHSMNIFFEFSATHRSNSATPHFGPRVLRGILHSKDGGPKSESAKLFLVVRGPRGFGRGRASLIHISSSNPFQVYSIDHNCPA